MNQADIEAEVRRRSAEQEAQLVDNPYKKQQRELWGRTIGKKLFDIIECTDLNTGDDIIIQVFADLKTRDLVVGEKVICQVVLLDQRQRAKIWFTEAVFNNGLVDPEGRKLIPELQRGAYTIL